MKIRLGVLIVAAVAMFGCSAKNNGGSVRSMEQIHAQEGVPAGVREVKPRPFAVELLSNAVLRGASETQVSSMVSENVASVEVEVGDAVQKDDVLVTFPTDSPSLNYEQARVGFQTAEETFNRMSRLHEQNGVSNQDFDNAKAAYEVAKANWQAVRDMVRVRAPISGTVTRLYVRPTQNVGPGDALLTISNYGLLEARIWVTDTEIQGMRVGLPATALWQSERIEGRVTQVDLAMDADREAFQVVTQFENAGHGVKSGVTAEVRIRTYFNPNAIVVQRQELLLDDNGASVFLFNGGKAVKRAVTIGHEQGPEIELTGGLKAGETLIVESLNLISDGAKVRAVPR